MKNITKTVKTQKTQTKVAMKDLQARKEIKGGQARNGHFVLCSTTGFVGQEFPGVPGACAHSGATD